MSRKFGPLSHRIRAAHVIAKLGKVTGRKGKTVTSVIVPGSKATHNQVIIRRHDRGVITTECRKVLYGDNYNHCKGNDKVCCYHSIAAIIMAMTESGYKPKIRSTWEAATKLAEKNRDKVVLDGDGQPAVFTLRPRDHNKRDFNMKAKPLYMVAFLK